LASQVVTAAVEQYDSVQLRLIDTPGLNLSNDPVASKARERGVAGLTRLLEERFEETLKEESRIIRTRKRQEDGMIHLGEHRMS
jgi:septin family protein